MLRNNALVLEKSCRKIQSYKSWGASTHIAVI